MQLLKNSKSCGQDNISAYFFEVAADVLAVDLSIIALFIFLYGMVFFLIA